jgi:hypothetical protein
LAKIFFLLKALSEFKGIILVNIPEYDFLSTISKDPAKPQQS